MTTLEKIRAEIYKNSVQMHFDGNFYIKTNDVLRIIDKYAEQEPCKDAISREDVEECKELMTDINGDTVYAVRMSDIRQLPSVTQKSKTGHWINHILSIERSCCGNKLFADDENENCEDYDAIDDLGYKFCPNCGARMVEPQESEG